MILDELVLHNFGLFRGRQSIKLAPPSLEKPIVLFGGLNGAGKTTLLDSIQLALYGKRARQSNRGTLPYDEYLRRCINSKVSPLEGAAIEVQFRQRLEGIERTYRINRCWSAPGNKVAERVEVFCNGSEDLPFTDAWDQLIEDVIPAGLSSLFFFDGEKIEAFADIENSAQLISKAIHSLLGLDLVDRLSEDLIVLANKQQVASGNGGVKQEILVGAEQSLKLLEEARLEIVEVRATKQNELDRLEQQLKVVELRYEVEGGTLLEERAALEQRRKDLDRQVRAAEDQLRIFTSGPSPFLLVADLLTAAAAQDSHEEESRFKQRLSRILSQRDKKVLARLKGERASKKIVTALDDLLSQDRQQRHNSSKLDAYLHVNFDDREALQHLAKSATRAALIDEAENLLQTIRKGRAKLADAQRKLDSVPDAQLIAPIIAEIKATKTRVDEVRIQLAALDMELARVTRERDLERAKWVGYAETELKQNLKNGDSRRIVGHSQRVRETLDKFRKAVVRRHVSRIQHLILDSFHQLLRKKTLVSTLRLDPEHFSLQLYDFNGGLLTPDRLSAGERQLLAVSILWGLARASGRPLPTVIDTPLGRLDTSHRKNLVERYFPYAGHQVLLLSTDEEINDGYRKRLRPWTGHTYFLDYDDDQSKSTVRTGYFR